MIWDSSTDRMGTTVLESRRGQRTPRRLPLRPKGAVARNEGRTRRTPARLTVHVNEIAPLMVHRLFVRSHCGSDGLLFWTRSTTKRLAHCGESINRTRLELTHRICPTSHHGQQPDGRGTATRSVRPRRRLSSSPEKTLCLQLREAARGLAPGADAHGGGAEHRQRLLRAAKPRSPPQVRLFGGRCGF